MLAKRLSQHGLAVSGAVLATALCQNAASACVPGPLVVSTVQAATLMAAGKALATGAISAKVVALTEGMLKAMLMTKLKITLAVVLALNLIGAGVGLVYCQTAGSGQPGKGQPVTAQKQQPTAKADATTPLDTGPWGDPVDGIACRLTMQPRYVIGQAISAAIEVKNMSNKKRYVILYLDPYEIDTLTLDVTGPKGKLEQRFLSRRANREGVPRDWEFKPIEPGEVKRFEVPDLRNYFDDLLDWRWWPDPEPKASPVPTGKFTVQFRFRSEKVPARFVDSWTYEQGRKIEKYKEVPAEIKDGQWANEAASTKVSFELAPLGKDDLVVHEWASSPCSTTPSTPMSITRQSGEVCRASSIGSFRRKGFAGCLQLGTSRSFIFTPSRRP